MAAAGNRTARTWGHSNPDPFTYSVFAGDHQEELAIKPDFQILHGNALDTLRTLPAGSVQCVVTSPPYWGLRDYGVPGQLGLERTPEEYLEKLTAIFREVRRVLRDDGTVWVNMGDSYCSNAGKDRNPTTLPGARVLSGWTNRAQPHRVHALRKGSDRDPKRGPAAESAILKGVHPQGTIKPKDLVGMPWRVAFALQADGWYLRRDIIWSKPNPMPESVTDRPTTAHEYLFLLTKSESYFYDATAIAEACSDDTHARYARRRSDEHKWAEGGPGGQTVATNKVGSLFAPATKEADVPGANNRQHREDREPTFASGSRNKRSVWTIPTEAFPEAHFATFPTALVEPCVLAGSSEKGCCPECGAPWKRTVEIERAPRGDAFGKKQLSKQFDHGHGGKEYLGTVKSTTTGWHPSCHCIAKHVKDAGICDTARDAASWIQLADEIAPQFSPVPCTVLDPFSGSGTVGVVALRHNRRYIGIELNPEYIAMSLRRIEDDAPLTRIVNAPRETRWDDLPLLQVEP